MPTAAIVHPWKVYAQTQSEEVDHCFEVYVPNASLTIGGLVPSIEGLTAVEETDCRYSIDDESEIGDGSTLFVAVVRSEDEDERYAAKVIVGSEIPEDDDEEKFLSIFPVARLSVDSSGDYPAGKVLNQFARSVVSLTEPGHEPDDISTALVTSEDAEDPNAIQVKDFDNDQSDGQQGLAERLELVKTGSGESATYRIKAKGTKSTVHILARVNGKIKYIPLSGEDEQDEDEKNPQTSQDPCEHPGSEEQGGVSADEDNEHSTSGGSAGGAAAGGVTAEGESHPGDPCNCN